MLWIDYKNAVSYINLILFSDIACRSRKNFKQFYFGQRLPKIGRCFKSFNISLLQIESRCMQSPCVTAINATVVSSLISINSIQYMHVTLRVLIQMPYFKTQLRQFYALVFRRSRSKMESSYFINLIIHICCECTT